MSNNIWSELPQPFFVLAPIDDVTDTVFRQMVTDCAKPDLFFTEFVNVDGLQSPGRGKLIKKLQFTDREKPIIAQLWGKVPENYYKTAKEIVAMGFSGVDINMGCPVREVVRNGCCVALVNNRPLAGEIIAAVREAVGEHFPVSVKTRLGLSVVDLTWHEFLLQQKLNALTIHGRTAKQMSAVPADWTKIGEVRALRDQLSPATKIIGNGDIMNRQHGLELARAQQLDGIMIGRGIFQDPFAFAEHSPWSGYSKAQRIELFTKHVNLFVKTWQPGQRSPATLNKFCKIYVSDFDGAKELREQLMRAQSTDELLSQLHAIC
jgi:tRNA-dihydrouridine synthase